MYIHSPYMSSWQRQIVLGTLLGGSSVIKTRTCRNHFMVMRGRQRDWLDYKAFELKNFAAPNSYHIEKSGYCRWHSCTYPIFNDFHELFYQDKKRHVRMEVLDELRDIGLMVWFLDAGVIKDRELILRGRYHGDNGMRTIRDYFAAIDLCCDIRGAKLHLDKKSTERFVHVIAGHMPKFMYYTLFGMC